MNKSIGIITQARMTSTRLPGKILKSAGGKTLLEHHINRLSWSGIPVFIATTKNSTDNSVADFAQSHNIICYRGDEENVLSRYYECARMNNLDIIIRVTSDCPLIDGYIIKRAVDEYLNWNNSNIYLSNCIERTYPRGFDFEIFSMELLTEAYEKATAVFEKEHVTPYINRNSSGNVILKHVTRASDDSNIRITVDTPEDFDLISQLINIYAAETMTCEDIIKIFKQHPELTLINAHIEQKKI